MRANQNILDDYFNKTDKISSNGYLYRYKKNKNRMPLISIIIPLFNEENTIKNILDRISNHYQYEIILVDDGSIDKSIEKAKEVRDKDIKIIKHKKNQGYGAAILSGFQYTTGDIIITLDSDGQHNPEEISTLIKPLIQNKADIVVGSRYLGKCHYRMPLYARVGSYFINLFLWLLYLQKVYDNQCGFRAYKKDTLKIMKNVRHLGMGFSTEILFKAAYYKYRIIEIPISINSRSFGTSYVNLIKITKSISSCILFYTLRKLKLDLRNSFLKKIINSFYKRFRNIKIFNS